MPDMLVLNIKVVSILMSASTFAGTFFYLDPVQNEFDRLSLLISKLIHDRDD